MSGLGCPDHAGTHRCDPGNPGRSRNAPPSPQPRSGFQGLALGRVQGQRPWPCFAQLPWPRSSAAAGHGGRVTATEVAQPGGICHGANCRHGFVCCQRKPMVRGTVGDGSWVNHAGPLWQRYRGRPSRSRIGGSRAQPAAGTALGSPVASATTCVGNRARINRLAATAASATTMPPSTSTP